MALQIIDAARNGVATGGHLHVRAAVYVHRIRDRTFVQASPVRWTG